MFPEWGYWYDRHDYVVLGTIVEVLGNLVSKVPDFSKLNGLFWESLGEKCAKRSADSGSLDCEGMLRIVIYLN